MHRSKRRIIGINVALALIMILALDKAASVFAAGCTSGCTASFTIGNGTLVTESDNGATVNNGTPVTLNGLDLQVPVSLPITVTDASGSGHGWKLQIEATQFANSVATPPVPLTGSYMAVSAVRAICADDSGNQPSACTLPANTLSHAQSSVDVCSFTSLNASEFRIGTDTDGRNNLTNYTLCEAAQSTGMGKIDLSPTIYLFIPADVYVGTYSSTITLTLTDSGSL